MYSPFWSKEPSTQQARGVISVALCGDAGDDQSFLMAGCYWNLDGIPKWKEDLWNG